MSSCKRPARLPFLVLALALASALGCGSDTEADVSGTVTLDGNAVGPGTIVFAPVGGGSNPATGTIQVDGSYFLMSNRMRGLFPGEYTASVAVYDQPPIPPGERSTVQPKLVTPERYADPSTSGLAYEVTSGNNTIDVELQSE